MLNILWIETRFLEGPMEGQRYAFATYRDESLPSGFMVGEQYRHNAAYMVEVLAVVHVLGPVPPAKVRESLAWARKTYKNAPLVAVADPTLPRLPL